MKRVLRQVDSIACDKTEMFRVRAEDWVSVWTGLDKDEEQIVQVTYYTWKISWRSESEVETKLSRWNNRNRSQQSAKNIWDIKCKTRWKVISFDWKFKLLELFKWSFFNQTLFLKYTGPRKPFLYRSDDLKDCFQRFVWKIWTRHISSDILKNCFQKVTPASLNLDFFKSKSTSINCNATLNFSKVRKHQFIVVLNTNI